uniref:Uncharacterized protein n=1 Tax=Tetranychus urticae TaxID=32264 RepID=T1KYP5_TETUR
METVLIDFDCLDKTDETGCGPTCPEADSHCMAL